MRTTIRIKDSILLDAKKRALEEHISLTAFIEESLIDRLYHRKKTRSAGKPLPTFMGTGLHPGVDLNDSKNLSDIMDGID